MDAILSVIYFLVGILVLISSGYWLTKLLVPQAYQKYAIAFSVLLGACWLLLISSWMSYLGLTFNQSSIPIVVGSFALSLGALIMDIKRGNRPWRMTKEECGVYALALLSGIVILFPIIFFNALRPYTDGFTYIAIADYLQIHSYFDQASPAPYAPWETQMYLYQYNGYRMGSQFLLSLLTSLYNQQFSIYVFMPLLAIIQSCLVLSIWLLARLGLRLPAVASGIATLFTTFFISIPVMYSYTGFLPQAVGIAVSVIIFLVFLTRESWGRGPFIIAASVSFSALIVAYSELLPFVGLSVAFLFLMRLYKKKKLDLAEWIVMGAVVVLTIALSNISFFNAVSAILSQMNAVVGWYIPSSLWDYSMFAISVPFEVFAQIKIRFPLVYFMITVVAFFTYFVVFKHGITNSRWKQQNQELFALSLPYLIMLVYFMFFKTDPWFPNLTGHSWNIFKIVQYGAVFIPIILGMAFHSFYESGKLRRYTVLLFSILFVGFSLTSGYVYAKDNTKFMREFTGDNDNPLKQYQLLYEKYKNDPRPINLILSIDLHKHRQMILYFLRDHDIVSDWMTDGYIYPSLPPEYRNQKPFSDGITLVYNPNAVDAVANMAETKQRVFVDISSGAYESEKNDTTTWRWAFGSVKIFANNIADVPVRTTYQFGAALPPGATTDQQLEVWYQDRIVETFTLKSNEVTNVAFDLETIPGDSEVLLKYDGAAVKLPGDPRDLAFSLVNFTYSKGD